MYSPIPRILEQAEANMANCLSVFELRAIRQAEQDHMHREWKDMALEDVSKGEKRLFYGFI